jgi:hypothetical protein
MLEAIHANRIVEIGAESGATTKHLVAYCFAHGGHVTAIEPLADSRADIREAFEKLGSEAGGRLSVVADISLKALPGLGRADAYLIDGDHNWYTVYHELRALDEAAGAGDFPLVLLDDVLWPFGRRDMYYDPSTLPIEGRHPYTYSGIWPGQPGVLERGGLFPHLAKAEREGGPRNGVRTAIEDFLKQSKRDLVSVTLPVASGLAIVVSRERLIGSSRLAALWDSLAMSPRLHAFFAESMAVYAATYLGYQNFCAALEKGQIVQVNSIGSAG